MKSWFGFALGAGCAALTFAMTVGFLEVSDVDYKGDNELVAYAGAAILALGAGFVASRSWRGR